MNWPGSVPTCHWPLDTLYLTRWTEYTKSDQVNHHGDLNFIYEKFFIN